jgi:hypothetical protein
MTPDEPFNAAAVPAPPDHRRDDAWLALPTTTDEADIALPALPALSPGAARVDVFFVHSTSSLAPRWNTPADDQDVRKASAHGGTLIQASAFNAAGDVYAPTYRQATGTAFLTTTPSGARAIDVAYADVVAAFGEFERRVVRAHGAPRPFLLVGHSQGAALLARLLREQVATGPARERLVAAYLIGAPLTADDTGGVSACARPDQTGCVVAYNARGPHHRPNAFDLVADRPEGERLCVNPTLGRTTEERAPRSQHGGAVFFDAHPPALLPRFAASACRTGRLVVEERGAIPDRGLASAVLLDLMGGENLHPIEFQLFYVDLRRDAVRRVEAFAPQGSAATDAP